MICFCFWAFVFWGPLFDSSFLSSSATLFPLDEQLLVGLRCREGVDIEQLAKKWGWDIKERKKNISDLYLQLQIAFEKGWIQRFGNRIKLTDPNGMDISNQVFVQMLLWWDSLPEDAVSLSNLGELEYKVGDLESVVD